MNDLQIEGIYVTNYKFIETISGAQVNVPNGSYRADLIRFVINHQYRVIFVFNQLKIFTNALKKN